MLCCLVLTLQGRHELMFLMLHDDDFGWSTYVLPLGDHKLFFKYGKMVQIQLGLKKNEDQSQLKISLSKEKKKILV